MRKTYLIVDSTFWAIWGSFSPVHKNFTNPAAGSLLRGFPSRIILTCQIPSSSCYTSLLSPLLVHRIGFPLSGQAAHQQAPAAYRQAYKDSLEDGTITLSFHLDIGGHFEEIPMGIFEISETKRRYSSTLLQQSVS